MGSTRGSPLDGVHPPCTQSVPVFSFFVIMFCLFSCLLKSCCEDTNYLCKNDRTVVFFENLSENDHIPFDSISALLSIYAGLFLVGCAKSLLRGKNGQFGLKEPLL